MVLNIRKRINAVRNNPERAIATLVTEQLVPMAHAIEQAATLNPLDGIVTFFNATSRVQDSGELDRVITLCKESDYGQLTETLETLTAIRTHVVQAGREQCGMNRTQPGDFVNDQNVFLGGIWGLNTHTVAYWKTREDSPKGNFANPALNNENPFGIVQMQARSFMLSHNPLLALTQKLATTSLA